MTRVRWYNRLAAWIYELIGDRLISLACPAWEEQADREIAEERGGIFEEFRRHNDSCREHGCPVDGHNPGCTTDAVQPLPFP